jgi:hypothetical protein
MTTPPGQQPRENIAKPSTVRLSLGEQTDHRGRHMRIVIATFYAK